MMFRCWRCGTWGWRIKHVCKECWTDNMKVIHQLAKQK